MCGQWARSLCINDMLETGTVGPYVDWAAGAGLDVVILNPNASRTPVQHVAEAWREFVVNGRCADVVMVAHSFGGVCAYGPLKP